MLTELILSIFISPFSCLASLTDYLLQKYFHERIHFIFQFSSLWFKIQIDFIRFVDTFDTFFTVGMQK